MRAKPEMKPWVNMDKSGLSSVGAALSARAFVLSLRFVALHSLGQLHNTALAALFSIFRLGHLQE